MDLVRINVPVRRDVTDRLEDIELGEADISAGRSATETAGNGAPDRAGGGEIGQVCEEKAKEYLEARANLVIPLVQYRYLSSRRDAYAQARVYAH